MTKGGTGQNTSSQRGELALLIKGVGHALGRAQHLLVGCLQGVFEELQVSSLGAGNPNSEPHSASLHAWPVSRVSSPCNQSVSMLLDL